MNKMERFIEADKFAKYLGVEMLEATDGHATARLVIQEHHLNSYNTIHGGAIFGLADAVLAAASNSPGLVAVAINANIYYLQARTGGVLTAQATELSRDDKTALYDIHLTDANHDLIALFQGTVYRTNRPLEE